LEELIRGDFGDYERLSGLGTPRAVALICIALDDQDEDVREAAAKALGEAGGEQAAHALERYLCNSKFREICPGSWKSRKAAASSLLSIAKEIPIS
jgi:HEAT repeat protein